MTSTHLSTELAAAWCRTFAARTCTARTVRRWVQAGLLTDHGDGRRVVVDVRELGDLMARS